MTVIFSRTQSKDEHIEHKLEVMEPGKATSMTWKLTSRSILPGRDVTGDFRQFLSFTVESKLHHNVASINLIVSYLFFFESLFECLLKTGRHEDEKNIDIHLGRVCCAVRKIDSNIPIFRSPHLTRIVYLLSPR